MKQKGTIADFWKMHWNDFADLKKCHKMNFQALKFVLIQSTMSCLKLTVSWTFDVEYFWRFELVLA